MKVSTHLELRKKCAHSEFTFWSVFSHIPVSLWIQSDAGKKGPEKLRIRTLFTQRHSYMIKVKITPDVNDWGHFVKGWEHFMNG